MGWSNALHARTHAGEVYLLGPAARMTLDGEQLHPRRARGARATGLAGEIRRNPYWSIAARAVELVHATAEAIDIVDGYRPPDRPRRAVDAAARRRRVGDRGPARACCSTTTRSTSAGGSRRPRSSRRPARTRPPSRPTCALRAVGPRPAPRPGDAPARAAHPELRPVHLVRHPLPGPVDRTGVTCMAPSRGPARGLRRARARRRRRRPDRRRRPARPSCSPVRAPDVRRARSSTSRR